MTESELQELEALAKSATPGPWERVFGDGEHFVASPTNGEDNPVMSNTDFYPAAVTAEDQAFCAAARSAVPALVAEVRRLRAVEEASKALSVAQRSGDVHQAQRALLAFRRTLGEP